MASDNEMRICLREQKGTNNTEVSFYDPKTQQEHRINLVAKGTQDKHAVVEQHKKIIEQKGVKCNVVDIR
jgi:hypothetical protein